jgi:hypothetical protein
MSVLPSITSEVRARRGDTALLVNLIATLGLLVIGYPLAPVTSRTMLLCWITIAVGVTQIVFGRQLHKTRSAAALETARTRRYKLVGSALMMVLCSLVVASVAARVSAAGDTFKQSADLAKRTAKTSEDVDKYVAQLDKTEEALSSVGQAEGKDLKKRYEFFSKELNALEDGQKRATTDIDEMKSTGAEYFASWDTSIAQMSNPGLKQASTEQRSKVMKDYEELAANLDDIGSQLQPFMSNLLDLKTFMGTDLSTENVSKAAEMVQKSEADAQALKGKIAGVQMMLESFLSEARK